MFGVHKPDKDGVRAVLLLWGLLGGIVGVCIAVILVAVFLSNLLGPIGSGIAFFGVIFGLASYAVYRYTVENKKTTRRW